MLGKTHTKTRIRNAGRTTLSARHVPTYIFDIRVPIFTSTLIKPNAQYTANGKKIEIAVEQIASKSSLQPSGTVANSELLKGYHKFKSRRRLSELCWNSSSGCLVRLREYYVLLGPITTYPSH